MFWLGMTGVIISHLFVAYELVAAYNRKTMCDCSAFKGRLWRGWGAHRHLKGRFLLLVAGLGFEATAVAVFIAHTVTPGSALIGMLFGIRWWAHTKQDRKKLAEKVLGRVKEMAWGLKVVPVGAAAMLLLSACGEESGPTPQDNRSDMSYMEFELPDGAGTVRCVQRWPNNSSATLDCDWPARVSVSPR